MRIQILELLSGNVSRAALLAATAALAGCSSDTGRFDDPVYTGSTPNQRSILGSRGGGDAYAGNAYAPPPARGSADRQWQNVDTTGSIEPGTAPVARAELTPPPAGAYTETVARPLPDGNRTEGMTQVAANGGWTPIGGTYVTLRQGETLDTLSGRYGVPIAALRQANNLQPGRTANPGDRVVIPVYSHPTAAAAPAAPTVQSQPVRTVAVAPPRPATTQVAPPPSRLTTGSVPAPAPVAAAPKAPAPAPVAPKVAATQPAPQPGGVKLVGAYTVKHGDTLASIARTYGVSEQSLRERNNLKTASLTPGQQILLPAGTKLMLKTSQAPAAATQPPAAAKPGVAPTTVAKVEPPKAGQAKPAVPVQTASIKPTIATGKDAARIDQKAAETIAVAREPTVAEDEKAGGTFRWPVRGRIISEYGAKANGEKNEGINLAVPEGTSVKAADGGEVIYSGNELKGYGNLVLVRHDNGFVSAYAHASELLVNRGDKVTRGQIIARAGATGSVSQPQLHFELRKGQKAVDPKPYLASN